MDKDFEEASVGAHVWYWVQLAIWPFIRSTGGCVYCVFLRGMLLGIALTAIVGSGLWLIWK